MWQLTKATPKHSLLLRKIADEILTPIYGNQDKAFREWQTGENFIQAFVAVNKIGEIGGFLAMKFPPDKPYLKIATLLVLNEHKGKGIASMLLNFVEKSAKQNNFDSILVTVSETKPESLQFFLKKGFVVIRQETGKYVPNVIENILSKRVET
jgi:ribosomal protein S18 acetylase RimI-like enzyme